jgi:RimJ/RimL family protein N-acetyltransferase
MLRSATLQDFSFIYSLYFLPDNNPYLLYDPMPEADFLPIFEEQLQHGEKYIFEVNNEAVGMAKLAPYTHRMSHIVYVGAIAIHPAFAGRGYGLQLLQEITVWAKANGYSRLELDVDDDNPRAKKLYEKAGFEVEGLLKKYSCRKTTGKCIDNYRMALMIKA